MTTELAITFIVLLEANLNSKKLLHNVVDQLPLKVKLELIHKGLYPLVVLSPGINTTVNRNKGNSFNTLTRYLLKQVLTKANLEEEKQLKSQYLESFIVLAAAHNIPIQTLQCLTAEEFRKKIEAISEKYLYLSILPKNLTEAGIKVNIAPSEQALYQKVTHSLCYLNPIPSVTLLNSLLSRLLTKSCYEQDRSFVKELEGDIGAAIYKHFEEIIKPLASKATEMELYE